MLIPEIALIAGTAGVFLALVSCLLVLRNRSVINDRLDELKLELDVHLSANHEIAKHLRALQKNQMNRESENDRSTEREDTLPFPEGLEGSERHSYRREPGRRDLNNRESGLSLAEKLGLSQSEADIVTHLRPRRSLSETV